MSNQKQAYEVERVIEQTIIDDKPHYLIKWKGYSSTQSTWEPIENLIESLDIVHSWKIKKSAHSFHEVQESQPNQLRKTKKIGQKQHQVKEKEIEQKLNAKTKKGRKKKKYLTIDQDDVLSIDSSDHLEKQVETNQFSFGEQYRLPRTTRSKIIYKNKSAEKSSKLRSTQFQQSKKDTDLNGFKVIGKVTKDRVQSVLWCFDWEDKKICEVELKDGRKVNMKRDDVKKICPDKLMEYYEKLEKIKL